MSANGVDCVVVILISKHQILRGGLPRQLRIDGCGV